MSLKALSSSLSAAHLQFIYSGASMPAPCEVALERFPRHTTSRRLRNLTWEERLPRRRIAYGSTRTNILNWRNAPVWRSHTTRPGRRVSGNTCRASLRSVYYSCSLFVIYVRFLLPRGCSFFVHHCGTRFSQRPYSMLPNDRFALIYVQICLFIIL